jgi:acetyl-CoA acetyltransferase
VVSQERSAEFSADKSIRIRLLAFAQARAELAFMPEAPVPAAQAALATAGIEPRDLAAVKTHNPFAINDIVLARLLPFPLEKINNFGCSLIWGHPHAATAMRSIIELIEELVVRGGGFGLFTGCAAGDSALAVVIKVDSKAKAF